MNSRLRARVGIIVIVMTVIDINMTMFGCVKITIVYV